MMGGQRRRMGGPYFVMFDEVHDILLETEYPQACRDLYEAILRNIPIKEEGWGSEDIWVQGRFTATKVQLSRLSKISIGHFYRVWGALIASNLIREDVDGSFLLLKYKKKEYIASSPGEIAALKELVYELKEKDSMREKELDRLRRYLLMYEKKAQVVAGGQGGKILAHEEKPLAHEEKPLAHEGPHPFKREEKISLSSIVNLFYTGIGQEKISKEKRERAEGILKKLGKDGFSAEDIAYAVNWTLENAKEELYDFAIIHHTIGQAMAAKRREEIAAAEKLEAERAAAEEQAEEAAEEAERERIEAYKESLGPEEREQLREQAEREIRASGDFKEDFISEYLISIKENEILRRRMAEQSEDGERAE